jgi:hypothetical protein
MPSAEEIMEPKVDKGHKKIVLLCRGSGVVTDILKKILYHL